jgi:hypothetical protein
MTTDVSLQIVVGQILQHTPVWVWGILATITAIGVSQLRERVVGARRLVVMPVVLGAYSLIGAASVFGAHLHVLAGWLAGMGLVVAAGLSLPRPVRAQALGDGRYRVAGSVLPLLTMWGVFGVRCVSTVTLILHPGWAQGSVFSLVMPVVYGALSGFFAARSLRILRGSAPAAGFSVHPA